MVQRIRPTNKPTTCFYIQPFDFLPYSVNKLFIATLFIKSSVSPPSFFSSCWDILLVSNKNDIFPFLYSFTHSVSCSSAFLESLFYFYEREPLLYPHCFSVQEGVCGRVHRWGVLSRRVSRWVPHACRPKDLPRLQTLLGREGWTMLAKLSVPERQGE